MKKTPRVVLLFSLVIVLVASMTATAAAARPQNPGQQGRERAASNNGASERGQAASQGSVQIEYEEETATLADGEISAQADGYMSAQAGGDISPLSVYQTIYADDPLWETTGTWRMERYSLLIPGAADILVGNIARDTASLTFGTDVNGRYFEIYSARYWSCGDMVVRLEWINNGGNPVFISENRVGLRKDGSPEWDGEPVHTGQFSRDAGGRYRGYRLTIEATGEGGPVDGDGNPRTYTYNGQSIPLAFVNVIRVEVED